MGQTPGMSGGQMGMSLLKSGLGGLSQGLANYGSNRPQQFDFSKFQQPVQRPALGAGVTPGAKKPNPLDPTNIDPFDPSAYGSQYR